MRSCKLLSVFSKYKCGVLGLAILISAPSLASVNVDKSRIVFTPGSTSASLSLHNSEKAPALVQLWTDKGDPLATPDSVTTPLIVNPPVFKMDPGEVRNVRLMLVSSADLPTDRESLFWMNVYQIPPNTGLLPKETRKVILPLKIRLKIFVRPEGLKSISSDDYKKVSFSIDKDSVVMINNPTAWHITMPTIIAGKNTIKAVMLAPFSKSTIHLKEHVIKGESVKYDVIDDNGAIVTYGALVK